MFKTLKSLYNRLVDAGAPIPAFYIERVSSDDGCRQIIIRAWSAKYALKIVFAF